MYRNHYDNEVERWKVNLVVSRAKRMGFRDHDLDDVQQQIVPQVKAFTFDADRSNRATEATALVALIDRQLLLIRRKAMRYQKHLDRIGAMCCVDEQSSQAQCPLRQCEEVALLVLDVRESIAKLSPREQLICDRLADGQSIEQIARHLGCGWHTIQRSVARIRKHFQSIGLDGWVSGESAPVCPLSPE